MFTVDSPAPGAERVEPRASLLTRDDFQLVLFEIYLNVSGARVEDCAVLAGVEVVGEDEARPHLRLDDEERGLDDLTGHELFAQDDELLLLRVVEDYLLALREPVARAHLL